MSLEWIVNISYVISIKFWFNKDSPHLRKNSVVKYFIMKIKLFKYNQFNDSIFGSRKRIILEN